MKSARNRFSEKDQERQRKELFRRFGYSIRFPGQHENEKTILTLRRHIWSFSFELFILAGSIITPVTALVLIGQFTPDVLRDSITQPLLLLGLSLYTLFFGLYFFSIWIDRYFDVWVITNERLIDVEQKSFFNRTASETELDKIQDVTVEVKGFLPTFFNYGTVYVQTAAKQRNFEIKDIKHPYVVKDVLVELERAYSNAQKAAQTAPTTPPPNRS